jgi:hypothetical protein
MQARKGATLSTRKWVHNPETGENRRLVECPVGWKEGKAESNSPKKETWNDGEKNFMIPIGDPVEPHWIKGMKPRKKK